MEDNLSHDEATCEPGRILRNVISVNMIQFDEMFHITTIKFKLIYKFLPLMPSIPFVLLA
jgi:hypothetical protein